MITILNNVEKWECCYVPCGAKCCLHGGTVPLTLEDVKRLKKAGRRDFHTFDRAARSIHLKTQADGLRCVFLQGDLSCGVFEERPQACRILPFKIAGVAHGDEPHLTLKPLVECPGYTTGPPLDPERLHQKEEEATRFLRESQRMARMSTREIEKELSAP